MILLLGATGYIGQAFSRTLQARGLPFQALSRRQVDYTQYKPLVQLLREAKPSFVLNAAGFTGKPNVDACEVARAETLAGNTLMPQAIAHACLAAEIPWAHVSSGCIYSGAKVVQTGATSVEKDLTKPELRKLLEKNPEAVRGFTEADEPNFTFRNPPCSFYSGTKALAEEAIAEVGDCYVWRLRIPFDEFDNPRNYLSKIQRYSKVYDNVNSLSHRGDFAAACLAIWEKRAPFGIYNVTNPGFVSTRQVVETMRKILKPKRDFMFWEDDEEFYRVAAKTPRSNCVLDVTKLLSTGVKLRPVEEAVESALRDWKQEI